MQGRQSTFSALLPTFDRTASDDNVVDGGTKVLANMQALNKIQWLSTGLKGQQDARLSQAFIKEIDLLRRARHPHVLQYLGAVVQGNRMLLVCEFCEGGDLWTALSQHDSEFQWYKRGRTVAYDVAQALNYLHSNNVIHFDLKSGPGQRQRVPEECPSEIEALYWSCLESEPAKRPDMRAIIAVLEKHQ
ncbi:hypothetical protein WJX73_010566 [Symbiochloris irregularis]|uniref:Protein kinase domain-containing protein n=1 Tax=Symbiochloris irregularis TaxID=706552 RepID=A0AAW1NXC6_9CHLO